jgi:hypothetical protein
VQKIKELGRLFEVSNLMAVRIPSVQYLSFVGDAGIVEKSRNSVRAFCVAKTVSL